MLGEKPTRWIRQTDFDNDEAVGFLGDRLARLGAHDVVLADPGDLAVRADPDRLNQILTNVLSNAVRHGAPPIHVTAWADGDEVVIEVRDHGHVVALETLVKGQASAGGRPHRRKERIPPGSAALRAAAVLTSAAAQPSTVISLAAYEQAAKNRNTLR